MAEIKVTPQQLKEKANDLESYNRKFRSEVEKMVGYEEQLAGMWEGEAQKAFRKVFNDDRLKMEQFALNIDKYGLDEIDNKILNTIIDKFQGGPVGLTTIATALGEDPGTLEEVYEPFLIKEGFMKRTPRGREVTELAYKHLGKVKYGEQGTLF